MAAIIGRRDGVCASALGAAVLAALFLVACGGGSKPTATVPKHDSSPPEFAANALRISGFSPIDVAATAVLAAYPPSGAARPNGWVLTTPDNWQQALLAAQFGAQPVDAGLLLTNKAFVPTPSEDVLGRLAIGSFPRSGGIQTLLFDSFGRDVLLYLNKLNLKVAQLLAPSPETLDLKLVPYRGGFSHSYSSDVVVVSSQARDYALPAGAWSAYSGDTIVFVTRDSVSASTRALLVQRQKLLAAKPAIYVLGPTSVISTSVENQLRAYGSVQRIAGPTPVDNAVAFARYRDPSTGFGWGVTKGPASVSLVDTSTPANAVAAYDFAATGPQAPLLLTSGPGALPPAVVEYLRQLRLPTRRNQGFVFGDTASISSATLQELDGLLSAASP